MRVAPATLAAMREWAATSDDLLLVVAIDGYSMAMFKEQIDAETTDDALDAMIQARFLNRCT